MRYYVLEVTVNSSGTETRNFTPYDNYETALRKFYAPFGSVGAGPTRIVALLLDFRLEVIKREYWQATQPLEGAVDVTEG